MTTDELRDTIIAELTKRAEACRSLVTHNEGHEQDDRVRWAKAGVYEHAAEIVGMEFTTYEHAESMATLQKVDAFLDAVTEREACIAEVEALVDQLQGVTNAPDALLAAADTVARLRARGAR